MRGKAGLVVGLAIGYVLGTRAGRERYEQIKTQWLKVWNLDPVQTQVGILRGQTQRIPSPDLVPLARLGGRSERRAVERGQPQARGALRARGGERVREDAVEGGGAEPGRAPRSPHPGGAKNRWLLQRERRLGKAEVEPRAGGVHLRGDDLGQPEKAAQGDQDACHSMRIDARLGTLDGTNIVPGTASTTPYK